MENTFEQRGREEKARKLARFIVRESVRLAHGLTPEQWENVAAQAGTKTPSDQTTRRVLEILEEIAI